MDNTDQVVDEIRQWYAAFRGHIFRCVPDNAEVFERTVGEMHEHVHTLLAAYDQLRADNENQAAMLKRWKAAIEGLTPSGSEYVDDPERCAATIRERTRWPKQIIDLRADNARLTGCELQLNTLRPKLADCESANARLTAENTRLGNDRKQKKGTTNE